MHLTRRTVKGKLLSERLEIPRLGFFEVGPILLKGLTMKTAIALACLFGMLACNGLSAGVFFGDEGVAVAPQQIAANYSRTRTVSKTYSTPVVTVAVASQPPVEAAPAIPLPEESQPVQQATAVSNSSTRTYSVRLRTRRAPVQYAQVSTSAVQQTNVVTRSSQRCSCGCGRRNCQCGK